MALVRLTNLHLTFRVRQQRQMTLKEYLVRRVTCRRVNPRMRVDALRDVNLLLKDGDRVGIVGHNGAGKSTLLRVLAGIYPPTSGTREVQGEISSLFDAAVGFEPEANGWENITFRGYLQGETPRGIHAKMQAIAEFSELGDFLNTPLKYYSSGMVVRLAFSIMTAINPEILLIDEVLSAGDLAFQKKCQARMREMIDTARLIVTVSHDLNSLREFCNKVVWMEHGTIVRIGPTQEILDRYIEHMSGRQLAAA